MESRLTNSQKELRENCKTFVEQNIAVRATQFDMTREFPREIIYIMGERGFLAPLLSRKFNGLGCNAVSFNLINEEINKACSTARSLITVMSMVCYAIERWGSEELKIKWLPGLACGEFIGAYALSEPDIGSQASGVTLSVTEEGDRFILNGTKKWISFGQIADVFLVFGQSAGKSVACLVESSTPGITLNPINHVMGCRASMLAEIQFQDCAIDKKNLIGGLGLGISAVAMSSLSIGRMSVASGCVGMAQAAMAAAFDYAAGRRQFDQKLMKFQLINRMLAEMKTKIAAARALCFQAADALDHHLDSSSEEIVMSKYFASGMVNDVLRDAVQIFGANGCCEGTLVERFFRDAKIMEIIEGSNEILQLKLGMKR
ncbi:acyl-CoA dehydrogenase family protein [Brenneria uluponensis]|uniref:acyl-CoA dehydrogenase family protein n=1 Tax=Brenneria uluponensis TaxID=3057057 RepID=UPI0028E385DC|nr:acyl-CoA dehydrogenase family protein [Brenneria ulupoensis]